MGATTAPEPGARLERAQPSFRANVHRCMRPRTVQVIAALVAAVAFILAFMAAGVVLLSSLFMALGLAAVAWLAWSLVGRVKLWGAIQQIRERRRKAVT